MDFVRFIILLQAEGLVLSLRDLFQVVFEMKKKEMEEAKKAKEQAENEAKVSNKHLMEYIDKLPT